MTARTRQIANALATLAETQGPESLWLARQSEALARIRAEREAENRNKENDRV